MKTNPFAVNYFSKESVIAYAKELGSGQVVYKNPERPNYNITHRSRKDLYEPEWVVYETGIDRWK
jgi:hypothetical protein